MDTVGRPHRHPDDSKYKVAHDVDLDRILRLCNIIRCYENLVEHLLSNNLVYYDGINYKEAVANYKDYLISEAKLIYNNPLAVANSLGLTRTAIVSRRPRKQCLHLT